MSFGSGMTPEMPFVILNSNNTLYECILGTDLLKLLHMSVINNDISYFLHNGIKIRSHSFSDVILETFQADDNVISDVQLINASVLVKEANDSSKDTTLSMSMGNDIVVMPVRL